MYQELINQIEKRHKQNGDIFNLGYDFKSHGKLESEVKTELGCELPVNYSEFLRISNGFDLNEVLIFASEKTKANKDNKIPGFVDENLKCRKKDKTFNNYLVFGLSKKDRFLFVYNIPIKEHQIIDEETHLAVERVINFEELIKHALRRSLFAY